ncbi:10695_t:CDS:2 [Acaulospora colombiana]|uniref:10695_t:CDS:1 n=1 Tax=Acaulospora colombiana TaxID=27376 RepID=A0ACA9KEP4_9GLOM|nr:10695_t:CDS:2 [Acaulospora colombiana]
MSGNLVLISSALSAISGLNVVSDDKFVNILKNYNENKQLETSDFHQFLVCGPTNTNVSEPTSNPKNDGKTINSDILFNKRSLHAKQLDIKNLHQSYLIGCPLGVPKKTSTSSVDIYQISIKTLTNEVIIANVKNATTVKLLKTSIHKQRGILPDKLTFNGNQLEDGKSLGDYNIQKGSVLYMVHFLKKEAIPQCIFISQDFLDPKYDYDFTNINDDDRIFMRGQYEYKRPVGWNRIALKVLNKYEDNIWLGVGSTCRQANCTSARLNEWPVSYHGTEKHNFSSIADVGYLLSKGKRFMFGQGVYSTPDINIAAQYATEFTHNGESYKMVFQNRVNPENLVRISADKTKVGTEYWISPKGEDIRPYGICIKVLNKMILFVGPDNDIQRT